MPAFAIAAEVQDEPTPAMAQYSLLVGDGEGRSGLLPYDASGMPGPPGVGGSGAKSQRLVVVVHGALRNSACYLEHAKAAAGPDDADLLIVAPQFLADVDLKKHRDNLAKNTLYWSVESWKGGAPAMGPEPVSSFSAMDSLLCSLAGSGGLAANKVASIVIVGNSAGGQYVNRYAAVGKAPDRLADEGVEIQFVIANPSTYLYFNEERVTRRGGPGINTWRYGFEDPPPYVDCTAEESLRRYARRDVTIMLGAEDRDGAALLLEVSAAAMAQGANRHDRGLKYHKHVQNLVSRAGLQARHRIYELDGVGHDAREVLAAAETRKILFG
jgi:hypothetical protein